MKRLAALLSVLLASLALPVQAQQYPSKPVRIIVPFAPGGGSDFIARFMAQRLTETLGSQVIVENKPGAGGVLGIEHGVKSPPDGYTLTLIASSYTVNPSIYKLNFDPVSRHHADHPDVAGAAAGGRQSGGAGQDHQGTHRARQVETR